jgi:hypothetical protein
MLKNGGLLRGTISELVPGDTVTIVTLAGATRRISMDAVKYAGPADHAPGPDEETAEEVAPRKPTPAAKAPGSFTADEVPVSFVAPNQEDVTLYLKTQAFTRVCTAPCEAVLPAGGQQLALGIGTQRPVALEELTHLTGRSKLVGYYDSHKSERKTGWAIFGVSLGLGAVLATGGAIAATSDCGKGGSCSFPVIGWVGVVGGVLGAAAGLGFALRFDEVDLKVKPE